MELISVHVPKTAGTAFGAVLRQAYGPAAVWHDYSDQPLDPHAPCNVEPEWWQAATAARAAVLAGRFRAVHGHFPADKYAGHFPTARRVAWVRHPVPWLVSLYAHWRRLPGDGHLLQRCIRDHALTFAEFAALPEARNRVSHVFFRGVPLDAFDFVGVQEFYADDLARLARLLGWPAPAPRTVNRNPDPAYQQLLAAVTCDRRLVARLEAWNADDLALYEAANRHRQGLRRAA